MEKRVEMNNDGMGMGISCENLKVRDTCTSSRIACLTRWAPGKQVQILSVLPTRRFEAPLFEDRTKNESHLTETSLRTEAGLDLSEVLPHPVTIALL